MATAAIEIFCPRDRRASNLLNWSMGQADYICKRMISWYASTTLLRTWRPRSKVIDGFWTAREAVCSSSPSPERNFCTVLRASFCEDSMLWIAPSRTFWKAPGGEIWPAGGSEGRPGIEVMEEIGTDIQFSSLNAADRWSASACL